MLKEFEGLRLTAYKCSAGVWTIGWGHTSGVKQGDKITLEQAESFYAEDYAIAKGIVDNVVDVELTENQFEALVSLSFNIGINAFRKSTLVKLLNTGDYLSAAMEFQKWSKVNGVRSKGLLRRRFLEALMFLK